jgi:hypothetical protein
VSINHVEKTRSRARCVWLGILFPFLSLLVYRYSDTLSNTVIPRRPCNPRIPVRGPGIGSGILGIFRLVPQSVVSKSGFRTSAPLSSPWVWPYTRVKRKAHFKKTKPNQTGTRVVLTIRRIVKHLFRDRGSIRLVQARCLSCSGGHRRMPFV